MLRHALCLLRVFCHGKCRHHVRIFSAKTLAIKTLAMVMAASAACFALSACQGMFKEEKEEERICEFYGNCGADE